MAGGTWSKVRAGLCAAALAALLGNTALMASDWLALAGKLRPPPGTPSPTADFARRLAPLDAAVDTDPIFTFIYNGETGGPGRTVSRAYHQHQVEIAYAIVPRLLDRAPHRPQALALFDDAEALRAWAGEHGYRVLAQNDRLAYLERE